MNESAHFTDQRENHVIALTGTENNLIKTLTMLILSKIGPEVNFKNRLNKNRERFLPRTYSSAIAVSWRAGEMGLPPPQLL